MGSICEYYTISFDSEVFDGDGKLSLKRVDYLSAATFWQDTYI